MSIIDTDILSEFMRGNTNIISKLDEDLQEKLAESRKKGKEIDHTNTLIAGIAIANNLQIIINNTDHFKRINHLKIDNWLL